MQRCSWARSELAIRYHDEEWGVPAHDDRTLFEFLILEAAQAGLSWDTVLKKREEYRAAFHGFDPARVAQYGDADLARLLGNPGLIRNRLKMQAAIQSAREFLRVQQEFGSFDAYVWKFTDAKALSKDLLKRGFRFVGPTICYAFMQATGMVNDHAPDCFRRHLVSISVAIRNSQVEKLALA